MTQRTYRIPIETQRGVVYLHLQEAEYRAYCRNGGALTEDDYNRYVRAGRVTQ